MHQHVQARHHLHHGQKAPDTPLGAGPSQAGPSQAEAEPEQPPKEDECPGNEEGVCPGKPYFKVIHVWR